jgi:hypothetical protein
MAIGHLPNLAQIGSGAHCALPPLVRLPQPASLPLRHQMHWSPMPTLFLMPMN